MYCVIGEWAAGQLRERKGRKGAVQTCVAGREDIIQIVNAIGTCCELIQPLRTKQREVREEKEQYNSAFSSEIVGATGVLHSPQNIEKLKIATFVHLLWSETQQPGRIGRVECTSER
jgi:hypothetical protein